ncbi:S-adenosyl-L-methionine dependent methyltransferase [Mollisia scopiformis]|uniref:S-adenosyl-L-methionine dependent methyltransferase n=1 Tax=Mollisia scopiformis TaxID=149040 RepID=A0A132B6P8_MOLSC|nr:S-adenosyl-L-methionine dependent methyltransferase [Mollisia scopiformis]KUJ07679.1 S-adenosyl-L-methionine dependent methyltransferase [Mollisia scopiformis]
MMCRLCCIPDLSLIQTVLFIYDFWVIGISNLYAWRCPTGTVLVPFFNKNLSKKHLDIGVGTGYFLAHDDLKEDNQVTLVDLNKNSLEAANGRIGKKGKYDSISLCYLLHCMLGPSEEKVPLFANVKRNLSKRGVLLGSTILGQGVSHNWFGQRLINAYNKKGLFGNVMDSRRVFEDSLRENFGDVECRVEGAVLLFEARRPRRDSSGGRTTFQTS